MPRRALAALLLPGYLAACAPPATRQAAAMPSPAAALRPAPPATARALVAASPDTVLAALGPPSLRRIDGQAEIWLYQSPQGCRLDLVFYHDGPALHVAAVTAHAPPHLSEAVCLKSLASV